VDELSGANSVIVSGWEALSSCHQEEVPRDNDIHKVVQCQPLISQALIFHHPEGKRTQVMATIKTLL
jgi:hypothetical protein